MISLIAARTSSLARWAFPFGLLFEEEEGVAGNALGLVS